MAPTLTGLTGLEPPLVPVTHPYAYDVPSARWNDGPFVRWPEHHVYARVHGDRVGIGSYGHRPVPVSQGELDGGAGLAWTAEFEAVIETAQRLLRAEVRFAPERRVNGVFAMTPDNRPFLGRHPEQPNVWVPQALLVTHAEGAARRLAAAMVDGAELRGGARADVTRRCRPRNALRESALRLYRDIYANHA